MSKGKHRKQPRRRPAVPSSVQNTPVNQEQLVDERRRSFIKWMVAGGTATAIGVILGVNAVHEEEITSDKKSETVAKKTGYEKWASGIEFPEMELGEEAMVWTNDEKEKYFLGKGSVSAQDRDRVDFIVGGILKTIKAYEIKIHGKTDLKERSRILGQFLAEISYIIYGRIREDTIETMPGATMKAILDINRFMMCRDYSFNYVTSLNGLPAFSLHRVNEIRNLKIKSEGRTIEIPTAFLDENDKIELFGDPNYFLPINTYIDHGNFIQINPGQQLRDIRERMEYYGDLQKGKTENIDQLIADYAKASAYHEGMHAALEKLKGFSQQDQRPWAGASGLNMGNYDLDIEIGGPNAYTHELTASGFGIMHAGSFARYLLYSYLQMGGNYLYVGRFIYHEIINDPDIDPSLRDKIKNATNKQKIKIVERIISELSEKKIYKIGERMAKVGLYMAQN